MFLPSDKLDNYSTSSNSSFFLLLLFFKEGLEILAWNLLFRPAWPWAGGGPLLLFPGITEVYHHIQIYLKQTRNQPKNTV